MASAESSLLELLLVQAATNAALSHALRAVKAAIRRGPIEPPVRATAVNST